MSADKIAMWDRQLNKAFDPVHCLLYRGDRMKTSDMHVWIRGGGSVPTPEELLRLGANKKNIRKWQHDGVCCDWAKDVRK